MGKFKSEVTINEIKMMINKNVENNYLLYEYKGQYIVENYNSHNIFQHFELWLQWFPTIISKKSIQK